MLAAAAALGASSFVIVSSWLDHLGGAAPELVLAIGAFCIGYLRRFGITGAGCGSQVYIGQLLAYTAGLTLVDLPTVAVAAVLAAVASLVPRILSGPSEHPPPTLPLPLPLALALALALALQTRLMRPELAMGLQAACATLIVVWLSAVLDLKESAWAITACAYVVAGSAAGTIERVKRRIVGTLIGVPLGLALLPLAAGAPLVVWAAAGLAMVIYAMALPERYDIACGAYAFTLIVTLAVSGEHSVSLLAARIWQTLLGGGLGLIAAMTVFPLRATSAIVQRNS